MGTKVSGFISTETKHSYGQDTASAQPIQSMKYWVISRSKIYRLISLPLRINFQKKKGINYAIRIPAVPLEVTKNIKARIYAWISLMVSQAMAATIREPRAKVTDLISAAPNEKTSSFLPTDEEYFCRGLSRPEMALIQCSRILWWQHQEKTRAAATLAINGEPPCRGYGCTRRDYENAIYAWGFTERTYWNYQGYT